MKLPSLKVVLLTPLVAFTLFYLLGAVLIANRGNPTLETVASPAKALEIAIFGASGTAGDGILEAALASKDIGKIQVITRRITPRMQAGINSGKAEVTIHLDYLDYSSIVSKVADVDAVFWAIGISSLGADEKTYGMIHVDFPTHFVKAWAPINQKPNPLFHFISSSDISEDSNTMWVREKIRAEESLFEFAEGSKLRVIAYRPDYIGPTKQQASLGQNLLYWFFKPVGAAVLATQIGQAMIDVSLREPLFENGAKLSTGKIVQHAQAYLNQTNPERQ
ncbi:MAG: hypothetical protein ACI9FR_002297 [Cryomorphaceae bacterium]|jgi:hypothetical protein